MADDIRIVLVEPSHPGNIGAAARAMKTMGLRDLCLVRPGRFPDPEAAVRATGADDVLDGASLYDSLDRAVADCHLVMGTTARSRRVAAEVCDAREGAREAVRCPGRVALVFGRERSGLTNGELDRCHLMLTIPTDPGYSSLNLGAAVQVLCYEVMMAHREHGPVPAPPASAPGSEPARAAELAHFYDHLEEVLVETGFLDPQRPGQVMRRLRRLFGRARPTGREVQILRGFLSAAQGARSRPRRPAGARSIKQDDQGI
ncbi:MAG TPA: RNA methyltransferase [Gammaproteobacteria bacterium]|nr:RNA methyltransferase [Gammaproteobacteria bacterium]